MSALHTSRSALTRCATALKRTSSSNSCNTPSLRNQWRQLNQRSLNTSTTALQQQQQNRQFTVAASTQTAEHNAATSAHARVVAPVAASSNAGEQPSGKPTRSSHYNRITDADLVAYRQIVGDAHVLTDKDALQHYNTDWMRKFKGNASVVVRPSSTEQVSQLMRYNYDHSIACVPQGGNTGLVGGSVPLFDEMILNLGRMSSIHSFNPMNGVVQCDAGVILENLSNYLDAQGYIAPLDLGAKGSCQLGGNLAANAGGLRLVRYGSLHGTCLGLEAVLADGTILHNMSELRKDNTGYDLKQLLIGSEGTLGVITKCALLCPKKPRSVQVAVVACDSYASVLKTMQLAKSELSDILSACEFFDAASLALVLRHIPGTRDPLSEKHAFYVLLETHGSNAEHDLAKVGTMLESAMEQEIVLDGCIAQDSQQQIALWTLRETITDALARQGTVYKYDVSLPTQRMYELCEWMTERLGSIPECGVVGYGHLGDGNLHLNIHTPKFDAKAFALIEPALFERVEQMQGSISAEHGLGQSKNRYLHHSKHASMIAMMRRVKQTFDPKALLNPYKVLPPEQDAGPVAH